jgi:Legionella pneumophila major outer membrane protein precursor
MRYFLALLLLPMVLGATCLDDLCLETTDAPCYEPYARAEMLYWRPTGAVFDFAYPVNPEGTIRPDTLKPINHFGWRLAAGMVSPSACWRWELSALVLRSDDQKSNDARLGKYVPPFGLEEAPRVHAQLLYDYWNWQLLLTRSIHDGEAASFYVGSMVRYAYMDRRQTATSQSFTETLEPVLLDGEEQLDRDGKTVVKKVSRTINGEQSFEKSKFWGVGPGLGVGGRVDICGGFAFHGHLYGLALAGQNRHSGCHCGPVVAGGLDMRLALTYEQEVDCYPCRLELGYELHRYFTPLQVSYPWLNGPNRRDSSVGFSGPTLSLQVSF